MSLKSLVIATKRLSNVKYLESLLISAVKPEAAEIVNLNKKQLEQGELSDGSDTQEYASLSYTNYKSNLGSKSVPNADLKDTGKFYDKINVKFKGVSVVIKSSDSKATALENKYTSDIYGLQKKNIKIIVESIRPRFIKSIKNEFNK